MDTESKTAGEGEWPGCGPCEKAFSLVRFFGAYQRNELGREAVEMSLLLDLYDKKAEQMRFAFGELLSLQSQRK